ncbi:sporulation protein [Ammoniphilus sp. CFH 90114]|uniref:sporulation protein n=1 Tax=Ammoniphilus sp. CFH 90114 TaxID=2493665 RepID=UPI00100E7E93|nr:sporulation protein [Ammoniphilus sp. CFH 90114]RXT06421.1 hypothetical protein EIZ39_15235 [Ammoniphilus sp. CFH 90114]
MLTFKKILSTIGIGCAKVHTVILQKAVQPGQSLKGEVHIYGGAVEQDIHGVDIDIIVEYYKDEDDSETHHLEYVLGSAQIKGLDSIKIDEEKIYPFEIEIPYHAPLTNANQEISLRTYVHIPFAPDPVEIQPLAVHEPIVETCFNLFAQEGYEFGMGSGMLRFRTHEPDDIPFTQGFILHKWTGNDVLEIKFSFSFEEESVVLNISDHSPFIFSRTNEKDKGEQLKELAKWIQAAT